jgi:hypothetical protein
VEEAEVNEVESLRRVMERILAIDAAEEVSHHDLNSVFSDAVYLAKMMRDGKLAFYEQEAGGDEVKFIYNQEALIAAVIDLLKELDETGRSLDGSDQRINNLGVIHPVIHEYCNFGSGGPDGIGLGKRELDTEETR